MHKRPPSLVATPTPMIDESPASWLMRTSQMHGVAFHPLLELLGVHQCPDPDVLMCVEQLAYIASGSGRNRGEMERLALAFRSVRMLPRLRVLLNFTASGRPSYRYCPACLAEDAVPYFRIEWRFRDWRVCPHHLIPMREDCPVCGRNISGMAVSLKLDGFQNTQQLDVCSRCSSHLWTADMCVTTDQYANADTGAQRAIVSAVVHGFFRIEGYSRKLPLDFYLWLREHQSWANISALSTSAHRHPDFVAAIVHKLLEIYRGNGFHMPPSILLRLQRRRSSVPVAAEERGALTEAFPTSLAQSATEVSTCSR